MRLFTGSGDGAASASGGRFKAESKSSVTRRNS